MDGEGSAIVVGVFVAELIGLLELTNPREIKEGIYSLGMLVGRKDQEG